MGKLRFPSMSKLALIVLIAGAALSLVLQLWLRPVNHAVPVPGALQEVLLPFKRPLDAIQLLDHRAQPFGLEQLRGHWTFLFFGYTHCPDVCPVALGGLAELFSQLPEDPSFKRAMPQAVFVSVDPERDTPEVLNQYVSYFNPNFIGVTGEPEQIHAFTRQVGVAYAIASEEGKEESNYSVDHTSTLFLVDPMARLVGLFSHPLQANGRVAELFLEILRYHEEKK